MARTPRKHQKVYSQHLETRMGWEAVAGFELISDGLTAQAHKQWFCCLEEFSCVLSEKGNKRTKLTGKIAVGFFLLKEFYSEYKVLTFPHSLYIIIIIFHILHLLFISFKTSKVPSSYCVECKVILFGPGHKEMKIHSIWNCVPRQRNGIGRRRTKI